MSLGGGQNKILPGAYVNFVALNRANMVFSGRGTATIPLISEWGNEDEVIEVTTRDFQRRSKRIFGYDFTHPKLRGLRDLFRNIRVGYFYRLGSGGRRAFFKLAKTFAKKRGSGGARVPGGGFGGPAPQASKKGCFL